ncbi:exodeoxyribonuclease III [Paracraurococcus lichenis]|uniref:Exodeoxyribonuclease III n=1 Tax=Paracraurococcus lichenis TaxID=3064888 RepID=A0ABT9DVD4_9PROT|nr:exodeoxyribonuclease III [Paracraurococcus sp. LOR1-02]MDO9707852.1 exodeoxyribonuclease III [Paracraurococcus sp. LOR1-02]
MTRLATFNVNSIRRRVPHLKRFLARHSPDLVVLQELKCRTEEFPALDLADAGYEMRAVGQPGGRNGVAVLGRIPFEVTAEALPGDAEDAQARFVAVRAADMEVAGIYLPNGNSGGEDGFGYKLRWMDRLADWVQARLDHFRPVAVLGDFNVCPTEADLCPGGLSPTDALVRPESRARFRTLLHAGMTDALRALHSQDAPFTYWDYGPAFESNRGLRIDHVLLSPELAERLVACGVDTTARSEEQPSDHAPVWCELR